jgi:hypothetical protein
MYSSRDRVLDLLAAVFLAVLFFAAYIVLPA